MKFFSLQRKTNSKNQQQSQAFYLEQKMDIKVHNGIDNFQCENCTKGFPTNTRIFIHQQTHLQIKPFVCNLCGRKTEET